VHNVTDCSVITISAAACGGGLHPAQHTQVAGYQRMAVVETVHQSEATAQRSADWGRTAW